MDFRVTHNYFQVNCSRVSYVEFTKTQINKSIIYLIFIKRIIRDSLGTLLLKGWKKTDKEKTALVDDYSVPEILRIQSQEFQNRNEKDIIKHSKYSREIFYVIKS